MEVQMHFEFKDFEAAFRKWRENVPLYGENIRFLISTHPYTSGYWIESVPEDLDLDQEEKTIIIYKGAEVDALEERIRMEIKRSARNGRSPRFVK